jgi:diacylglycerol kinase family enzyme
MINQIRSSPLLREYSILALINPQSGGHSGGKLMKQLSDLLHAGVWSGSLHTIDFSRLHEQLQQIESFDYVLIGGGDGTVSKVISACQGTNTPFIIIPLGTGNDLAREVGLVSHFSSKSLESALQSLDISDQRTITVWNVTIGKDTRSFINYLSLGFDATVAQHYADLRDKKYIIPFSKSIWLRRMLYCILGLTLLRSKIPPGLQITSDSANIPLPTELSSLIFANIKSFMGIGTSCIQSDSTDELVELIMCSSPTALAHMIFSWLPGVKPELVTSSNLWTLYHPTEALYLQLDGEPIGVSPGTPIALRPGSAVRLVQKSR